MKPLIHTCALIGLLGVVLVLLSTAWLLSLNSGLSTVSSLNAYLPAQETLVPAEACLGPVHALPASEIRGLYSALDATGVQPAQQIARTMFCKSVHQKQLVRQLNEMRLAMQIRWHFTPEQQRAIYLNRAYFGDGQYGIAQGAQHYFGATVPQLSTADSALLIGLISNPAYYSPYIHPDHALARRNTVIENSEKAGILTEAAAEAARFAPLGVK